MNELKQNSKKSIESKDCGCSNNSGLFIPNRKLSFVTAASMLVAFITFMTGYFVGQHHGVESFSSKIEQESFADQIYASLFGPGEYKSSQELTNQDTESLEIAQSADVDHETIETDECEIVAQSTVPTEEINESSTESLLPQESYCAQLIGFGTEQAAQKFVQKLATQDIPAMIRTRNSKTAKGKTVSWYQVVTQKYNNKENLQALVDRIEKTEKIKGAQIISC